MISLSEKLMAQSYEGDIELYIDDDPEDTVKNAFDTIAMTVWFSIVCGISYAIREAVS